MAPPKPAKSREEIEEEEYREWVEAHPDLAARQAEGAKQQDPPPPGGAGVGTG